jgi:hypothetical protein
MYSFIETKLFSRLVADVLTDEEYSSLQNALIKDPEAGDLIPGSGGIRKLRWGVAGSREARWYSSGLLRPRSPRTNMDAYTLREERGGQYPRQRASPN